MVFGIMHNMKIAVIFLLTLMFLSSCELLEIFNQDDDLSDFIASVKAKPKRKIEPDPVIPEYVPYPYIANKSRSPFQVQRSVAIRKNDPNCKKPDLKKETFMQQYDLNDFKYVGPFLKIGEKMANGKNKTEAVYGLVNIVGRDEILRIRKGDVIGKNHGVVTKIHSNAIELEEKISDGMGGWICRSASIGEKLNF